MNNFNTLFPNFLNQCAEMNRVLTPIAFVLLAVGVVSSTVTGHRSPSAYLRTIGRTLAFVAVLSYLPTWGNEVAAVVDTTVRETLKADPTAVYAQYQKALAISKGTSGPTAENIIPVILDEKSSSTDYVIKFLDKIKVGFSGEIRPTGSLGRKLIHKDGTVEDLGEV